MRQRRVLFATSHTASSSTLTRLSMHHCACNGIGQKPSGIKYLQHNRSPTLALLGHLSSLMGPARLCQLKLVEADGSRQVSNQVHRKSVRKGIQFTAMVVGGSRPLSTQQLRVATTSTAKASSQGVVILCRSTHDQCCR
ncbi:uncharacterized protein LAESUDRAFT_731457 [Laetiporus sulphureus 93-53]|uniref:Uncharacterized protein n=1 Tax=Laetiporus sulphureus 93-53 TaxID=1314785 RepID=A0A165BKR2_9APHY|nr:uncharacterized protein LAESUDRAFT_731457 [Laetiporus sulphureus 93-53]KZT01232.1 hypothetical protein LAESUDRAFT_731457 [Laetiporus sulphureus 93-53]